MPNQIKRNGKQDDVRRKENSKAGDVNSMTKMRNDDDYCDVFPNGDVSRKAQNVGKLKRDANEKSQVGVKKLQDKFQRHQQKRKDESLQSEVAAIALGRTRECLSKICQYLDYVHEICENPPEMEDMTDLRKRQKRSSEFSNRFARNHLYQIGRIVSFLFFLSFFLLFLQHSYRITLFSLA